MKARMTVRGYKDLQASELKTFSATTSRWGQRVVAILAAQRRWKLFSLDVAQALLRGMPFEELAKLDGEVKRSVQFTVPPGSLPLLRMLPGFEDFDGERECLDMLRAGFGLKDVPRAWNMVLTRLIREFGLHPTKADDQVFLQFDKNDKLVLVVSAHVDDLKACGEEKDRIAFVNHLENRFGKLKQYEGTFEHVGMMHAQYEKTFEVRLHQKHYAAQLRPICLDDIAGSDLDDLASAQMKACYMTLLGGVAWMILTCPASAVYVSYLQRHLQEPRV